jgi:hypothetical protein
MPNTKAGITVNEKCIHCPEKPLEYAINNHKNIQKAMVEKRTFLEVIIIPAPTNSNSKNEVCSGSL